MSTPAEKVETKYTPGLIFPGFLETTAIVTGSPSGLVLYRVVPTHGPEKLCEVDVGRLCACWNAMVGPPSPAAAIEAARKALRSALSLAGESATSVTRGGLTGQRAGEECDRIHAEIRAALTILGSEAAQ